MNTVKKRVYQYWFVDGIYEIGFGCGLALFGATYYGIAQLQPTGLRQILMGFGYPFLVLGVMWGVGKLVRWMKHRITYPRSGYVGYHRDPWRNQVKKRLPRMALALFLILAANATAALCAERWGTTTANLVTWVLFGTVFAGAAFWLGLRFGLKRYYVLAVHHILAGAVTGVWVGEPHQMLAFMLLAGIGWTLSGLATLLVYLRRTAKDKGEADGETITGTDL
ncbi:MAG: hypothetical protein HPY85_00520 [Anaerolineae bacterium]|nr:hypothetical protein [Anaerolineae bacterium]